MKFRVYETRKQDGTKEYSAFSECLLNSPYVTGSFNFCMGLPTGGFYYYQEVQAENEEKAIEIAKKGPPENWQWSTVCNWGSEEDWPELCHG